jgi:hypothetical protein
LLEVNNGEGFSLSAGTNYQKQWTILEATAIFERNGDFPRALDARVLHLYHSLKWSARQYRITAF